MKDLHIKNYLHIIEKLQEDIRDLTKTNEELQEIVLDKDNRVKKLEHQIEQNNEMITRAFDLATKQTQRANDLKKDASWNTK